MDWLRRIGRPPSPSPGPTATPKESGSEAVEGATPGIAALLEGVRGDRSHSVLDLGPATHESLFTYGRFARWVRFADLFEVGAPFGRAGSVEELDAVPAQPDRPYDLIFGWDVLDRLGPEERPRLIERLTQLTAPDARLHVMVRSSDEPSVRPLRFTLLDHDRMRYEPIGPAEPPPSRLLPAKVETLLEPFRVVRGFTLKNGLREYVAVRGRPATSGGAARVQRAAPSHGGVYGQRK